MESYEAALGDIKFAYSLDSSNKEIYESYAVILKAYNEMIKKDKEKQKEMSGKMLGSQK